MKEKILSIIEKLNDWIPTISSNKYVKVITWGLIAVLFIFLCLFVYGWFFNLNKTGTADLVILSDFLKIFCSSGFAGLVLLLVKLGIDKNKDGQPDFLQEEQKTDERGNR